VTSFALLFAAGAFYGAASTRALRADVRPNPLRYASVFLTFVPRFGHFRRKRPKFLPELTFGDAFARVVRFNVRPDPLGYSGQLLSGVGVHL